MYREAILDYIYDADFGTMDLLVVWVLLLRLCGVPDGYDVHANVSSRGDRR